MKDIHCMIMSLILFTFFLTACQSNSNDEIVEKQGFNHVENVERLNKFVENVNAGKDDEIDFIVFGEEGERIVTTLEFKDNNIDFTRTLDRKLLWSKFIEEFSCPSISIETKDMVSKYILVQCTDEVGEYVLAEHNNEWEQ
ncbi:DUF4362 domain-containing protein [Psychrobacillus sp. PGGUH221]|uniref:DUF4362 domain-containing protein n=1 Tax=Psychrobacillus sp. PGGUH221 TaxID=3020058 RepID=UPI0035C69808